MPANKIAVEQELEYMFGLAYPEFLNNSYLYLYVMLEMMKHFGEKAIDAMYYEFLNLLKKI